MNADSVRFVKAWVLFILLATICSAGAGMLVGAVAGAAMGAAGVELSTIMRIGQLLGFLVSLPISFIVFRWSITKYILPQLRAASDAKLGV